MCMVALLIGDQKKHLDCKKLSGEVLAWLFVGCKIYTLPTSVHSFM